MEITLDALEQYVTEAAKASDKAAQASKDAAEVLGSLLGEETWTPVFVNALREQLKAKGVEPPEGLTLGQLIDLVGTIETVCEPEEPSEPDTPSEPTVDLEPYKVAWEADRTEMTELVIPEGITKIANGLFQGANELRDLTIPENVTEIGDYAFDSNSLETLTLNNKITKIGTGAFRYSKTLKSVTTWPKNLYNVPDSCFQYAYELETFTFHDLAFEEIGSEAFNNCWKLDNVVLPETLCHIRQNAFCDCHSLKRIVFPEMLATLGLGAFHSCIELESVTFNEDFSQKYIDMNTFASCAKLKSIELPKSIASVYTKAFFGCYALETVTFPNKNKNITFQDFAFDGCRSLKELDCTSSYIGGYAFRGCTSMERIHIQGVISILYGAFEGVPSTCEVYLGTDLANVMRNAKSWGFASGTLIICQGGEYDYVVP